LEHLFFKTEKIHLKNIALYIRYGSIKANHEAYCDVVPLDLKIGRYTFRKVLSARTLKGTYNQALRYYLVGLVDMIQFVSDMPDRLGKIVNGRRIDRNQKADIKLWLEKARENTRYTSEYLRHTFYADIVKTGTNGFTMLALDWERGTAMASRFPPSQMGFDLPCITTTFLLCKTCKVRSQAPSLIPESSHCHFSLFIDFQV
jgi:hypothetical protein